PRLLEPLGVVPELLIGGQSAAERRAAGERLDSGEPLIAVGTHALVQDRTPFRRLGLVVIAGPHRFGVEQRQALGAKGESTDVLLMSATPIPRWLALTAYGDLGVSVLDERPPGRKPITTVLRPATARGRVLAFLDREI